MVRYKANGKIFVSHAYCNAGNESQGQGPLTRIAGQGDLSLRASFK